MWSQHCYRVHIILIYQTYDKQNMSTKKWTKQSNSLIKENSVNVIEGIEKSMAATCIRQTSNAKARKDTMTDSTTRNAARLLGKTSWGTINNNDTSTPDQEATGKM